MNKFLALGLAGAVLAAAPLTEANAHEAPAPVLVPFNGSTAGLPTTVRINDTVVIRHRTHRRYRTIRTVRYRHGRRIVTTRRVYY